MHTITANKIHPTDVKGFDPAKPRRDLGDLSGLIQSITDNGLILPIILGPNHELIDGERRLTCFHRLNQEIPFVYRSQLASDELEELELEANRYRKDFTWQEEVLKGHKLYRAKCREASLMGEKFTQRDARIVMGCGLEAVNIRIKLAKAILSGNTEVSSAPTITAALQVMLKQVQENIQATQVTSSIPELKNNLSFDIDSPLSSPVRQPNTTEEDLSGDEIVVPLSQMFFNGDCREIMSKLPADFVDHIITDPPYGINPDNMDTLVKLDEVYHSHQVDENISLILDFIQQAFRTLKDQGFLAMWYDLDHHEKIVNAGTAAGFKVCRWPLIACKISSCRNSAAAFNVTKRTEYCILMRKGNAVLTKPITSNYKEFDFQTEKALYDNPFAKPFDAWKWIIDMIALPGQSILDAFSGAGSGPRASAICGMRPYGIEKDQSQFPKLIATMKTVYLNQTRNRASFV